MKEKLTKLVVVAFAAAASVSASAEQYVDITGAGAQKYSVQISVGDPAFAKSLSKNLELSCRRKVRENGRAQVF